MKTCTLCGIAKPLTEFHKRSVSPDGKDCRCKPCRLWSGRQTRNKEACLASALRWQIENRERANQKSREWRARNKERRKAILKAWEARNPGARNEITKRRRMRIKTPQWADKRQIASVYKQAAKLTMETGIPHHVDHIVPISSPLVCGLHVEFNLSVLTSAENTRKQNRFWPDMP